MDRLSRCLAYLERLPPAISGEGGHNATFRAACEVVRFGLAGAEAWEAMRWWNAHKCTPPWTDHELEHKLSDAQRHAQAGERVAGDRPHALSKAQMDERVAYWLARTPRPRKRYAKPRLARLGKPSWWDEEAGNANPSR